MRKVIICMSSLLIVIPMLVSRGNTQLKPEAIEKVRPTFDDIPEGFAYGKVPGIYKKVLKDNPWMMDAAAIKRLADKIYPGGDFRKIANIHVSIIANKNTPFGDDIVCYIILYRDMTGANEELKKITEFTGFNRDRVLLLSRENLVVLLHVDDIDNFHYIQSMAGVLEERMKGL